MTGAPAGSSAQQPSPNAAGWATVDLESMAASAIVPPAPARPRATAAPADLGLDGGTVDLPGLGATAADLAAGGATAELPGARSTAADLGGDQATLDLPGDSGAQGGAGGATAPPDLDVWSTLSSLVPEAVAAAPRPAPIVRAPEPPLIAGRYALLGTLGQGGMGVVYKVRDQQLRSMMAMKVIRPELQVGAAALARFVEEAQATAQLQHPGVVAVHELGRLADGRLYFTMEMVQGRTLRDVLLDLHAATALSGSWAAAGAWSLRRVLSAFHQACLTVAYAHARGVIHRDLKPENIMLGEFGEVRVLDWGLARVLGRAAGTVDEQASGAVDLSPLGRVRAMATQVGSVAGTLAYMAPEQARGEIHRIGAQTDVFALGATLYHILCGEPPFGGTTAAALAAARAGRVPVLRPLAETSPALLGLLRGALAADQRDRPADAGVLAAGLGAWLDGARRRDDALAQVAAADALADHVRGLYAAVEDARMRVRQEQQDLPRPASPARLAPLWAAEDDVRDRVREHALAEQAMLEHLRGALNHEPDLPEAHARLAAHFVRCHAERAATDPQQALVWEQLIRQHDRAGAHADWLSGTGLLQLRCAHPGATGRVLRFVEQQRRLVPVPLDGALSAPIPMPIDLRLPAGSYLVEVAAPGRATAPVPVLVERAGRWDAVPPEGGEPHPVWLPPAGAGPHAPEDEAPAFVAAGWAWVGARRRDQRIFLSARRVWVDDLWVDRHPVTNTQFIRFLDDLVAQGDEAAALAWAPRYRSTGGGGTGPLCYGRRPDGGFCLVPDADGDVWQPAWPVFMVTWAAARAYAAWRAARTGQPWRLPTEYEWRKALGGVDGRSYPWGEAEVDAYANTRFGRPGRMLPAEVGAHPEDQSPYGVCGGAGGVMDWCLDTWADEGPPVDPRGRPLPPLVDPAAQHPVCGGSWSWPVAACTLNIRNVAPPTTTREWWGLRLVCDPLPHHRPDPGPRIP
ncbi:MAG: hypothetical protein RL071_2451 [Pseudomonadota bacterium]